MPCDCMSEMACMDLCVHPASAVLRESAAVCVTDRWPAERQIIGCSVIATSLLVWRAGQRSWGDLRVIRGHAKICTQVSQWGTLSESAALDWTPLLGSAAQNLDRVCQIERTQENWTGKCVCVWRRAAGRRQAVLESELRSSSGP